MCSALRAGPGSQSAPLAPAGRTPGGQRQQSAGTHRQYYPLRLNETLFSQPGKGRQLIIEVTVSSSGPWPRRLRRYERHRWRGRRPAGRETPKPQRAPTCDLKLRVLASGRCEPLRRGRLIRLGCFYDPTNQRRGTPCIQKPANRVLASPNSASSTPIRSMMPRYRLHNLRLSSPDSK